MEINDGKGEMEGRDGGVLSKCLLFTAYEYSCRYRVSLSMSISICLSIYMSKYLFISNTAVRTLSCRYIVHRDEGVLTVLELPE